MTAALTVTDHALVRFLERVMGLDVEAVRAKIAATPGLAQAAAMGARQISIDGFTYSIVDRNTVATIQPGRSPVTAKRGGMANRHGLNVRGRTNGAMYGRGRDGGRHDRAFDGGE